MVAVIAAEGKRNSAAPKPASLALKSSEFAVVLQDEVAAGLFAEGHVQAVAKSLERGHHCECRPVADVLRVFHVARIAYTSDGTMGRPPE
jgi:hypothetical protein